MGTQAHWFSHPWRARPLDEDGEPGAWVYSETLADIKADADGESFEVQKRTGRKSEGYVYVPHSVLNA